MRRRGDTWTKVPFSWIATERPEESYQSIENPTQPDRISDQLSIPIETVAPKTSGWFGVYAILYFFFWPIFWCACYCYWYAPQRSSWVFVLLEVLLTSFGLFYFLFHYPKARRFVQNNPLVVIAGIFLVPILAIYDNLAIRLHITMFVAILVADLFSDTMLKMATCFPVPRESKTKIQRYWQQRYKFRSKQLAGVELHWLTLAILLLTPMMLLISFVPNEIHLTGIPFFWTGVLLLFLSPWVVEKIAAFVYARKSVSFLRMIHGFSAAISEWVTYQTVTGHAPGVFQPSVPTIAGRRRLTHSVLILLAMSAVPFIVLKPIAIHYAQLSQSIDDDESGELADISDTPIYKQKMLDRMSESQRQEFLNNQNTTDNEFVESNTAEGETTSYAYGFKLLFLTRPIVAAFMIAAPWVLSVTSPFIFFFGFCFALSARITAHYPVRQAGQSIVDELDSKSWSTILDATNDSLAEPALFFGVNAYDNAPIIAPRHVLNEHMHIQGDTGSGKTSLGLAPLLTQLVRQKDCSVIVVDLKGDELSLFHGLREESLQAGTTFKWFTNQLDRSTYLFNPLAQRHFSRLSTYQKTDVVLGSLGLQYGNDYGRGYFSDANSQVLYHCFRNNPDISTFDDLAYALKNKDNFRGVNQQLLRDGAHLQAIVSRLASCEPLNVKPNNQKVPASCHSIDMGDPFESPSVYYFYLSSALGTTSSAEMARLALFSLLSAAKFASEPRRQIYLCVDEFQRITSKNLELFLQTARSFNIGVILANQTLNDLKTSDVDLATTVKANCRIKQHFSASDPVEIAEIVRGSGETVIQSATQSLIYDGLHLAAGRMIADGVSIAEQITPRLSTNQVLLAGDHPYQSIFQIRRGAGTAQFGGFPFILRGCHHIKFDEYKNLQRLPWPAEDSQTITPQLKIEKPEFDLAGYELHESPILEAPSKTKTSDKRRQ